MCGVESPRWERYCDAAFPGRSAKPWGCGDGGKREGGPPARGPSRGAIPSHGAWEERPLPPWRRGPVFGRPPPSLAEAGLSPLQQEPKAPPGLAKVGAREGGGRAPFAGRTPLRAEDKASERSGSATRAWCAMGASSGQERRGVQARTGLGEEAEFRALESESPARSGSQTTCSCCYLPAPPRKQQQCFSRARVCVCERVIRECVRGVCGVCVQPPLHTPIRSILLYPGCARERGTARFALRRSFPPTPRALRSTRPHPPHLGEDLGAPAREPARLHSPLPSLPRSPQRM